MLQNDFYSTLNSQDNDENKQESSKDLSSFVLPRVRSEDYDHNKAKENLAKAKELNKQKQEEENITQTDDERYFKSTKNRYLDDKLKKGTLTGMDMYVARKYLGLDMQDFGYQSREQIDMNLNAKVKGLGLTGLNDRILQGANNQDLFDRAIIGSEGNLGFWSGAERLLNRVTGGFKELDPGEQEWVNTQNEAAYALASARKGGKLNEKDIERAQDDLALGVRQELPMMEKYTAAKKTSLAALGRDIENALKNGLPVNTEVLDKYEKGIESVSYLEDKLKKRTWGKHEYKEYAAKFGKDWKKQNKNLQDAKEGFNSKSRYDKF